jgi:pimeloyl-ACP methyl ester carboxylesterase
MERFVRTTDGRTLAVEDAGDPAGRAVLVHHAAPGSRYLYGPNVADAAARGLRLISYDRPGYGGSTPCLGRAIADCASDIRAICAALEIGRLAMWSLSAGGPYLLACAALLPDLVTAAACLASPAPYGAQGLDWYAGMDQGTIDFTRLLLTDPGAGRAGINNDREGTLALSQGDLAQALESVLTPADAAVVKGELAGYLIYSAHQGLAPGSQGLWNDVYDRLRPWGFELAEISIPVLLMHGRQDGFLPVGHGQWLAAQIPGVDARFPADEGHLTLLDHRIGEVHSWLAERL